MLNVTTFYYSIQSIVSDGYGDFWIGATNLDNDDRSFFWSGTNLGLTYTDWPAGEPSHTYAGDNENCVLLSRQYDYRWNDFSCNYPQYYACEEVSI